MKKRALCLLLAALLALGGCSAMLEQTYTRVEPAEKRLFVGEDSSVIAVGSKSDLTTAILSLVRQGMDTGVVRLMDYRGDVETDLADACLEVAQEDPLGAYAVESIRYECSHIISYYEANIHIDYRRTHEQVRSMVNVTGVSAIRAELRNALNNFDEEVVLRVAYLAADEASLAELVRQAYYDTPVAALGMPQVEISLYPGSGRQRVVEILLTYPGNRYDLRSNASDLSHMVEEIAEEYWDLPAEDIPLRAARALWERVVYDGEGPANAYGALVEKRANSEGMALSYSLLCGRAFVTRGWGCDVVEGIWKGSQGGEAPRFWNVITSPGGASLYFDPTQNEPDFYTAQEFFELGYRWSGGPTEPEPTLGPAAEPSAPVTNGPADGENEENPAET